MQGDDPPYLEVGTAVSAKYKGAFCEAKVSNVVRNLKCKVSFKMGLGTATLGDEQIEGNVLRVGHLVQAKHPDKKELVEAVITKIQDCSQYTVVFDDGDITTLRRTALCLKSGRHFNESETLDQLPLTHPEHFGNPVVGGRRGRRSRQLQEDSSEGEAEEENEPDLELYSGDIGKVVSVETSDKKRNKDNWFPGLIVTPSAQPTVRINVKDEFLIRSFKDGRYYTVPKKEVSEFSRELGSRVESTVLAEAVDKALKYLDNEELPVHWERSTLFNSQPQYSDSDENFTDSSDDEPREEKDHFVAQLYKFMDDSGTPLNKSPMIASKDVDLYRLFRVVHKLGGYNRVSNQNKWRSVTLRLRLPNNQNTHNQVKSVYKKCLFSYESFYRTLGCTMLNHTRNAKKNRGRPLIREKDRATPVQSPKPEKDDEEKKEDIIIDDKSKVKKETKPKEEEKEKEKEKKKRDSVEASETSSNNSDVAEQPEVPEPSTSKETKEPVKVKKVEAKGKKSRQASVDKAKSVDRLEEAKKDDNFDSDKTQQTRSKSISSKKETTSSPETKPRETKTPLRETTKSAKVAKKPEEEKKRGRKRTNPEDKSEVTPEPSTSSASSAQPVNKGDKLKVYYGPTHESKVTYEAKVIEIDREAIGFIYLVHYTGWNTRYDEWITPSRIAENLSATTKAKRLKQGANASGKSSTPKVPSKRGRGMSITGRSTLPDTPRSTTPSSVTSTSSRTKSPATPATRGSSRLTRQGEWGRRSRRVSVQTDASLQSDSESDASVSEAESTKSKPGKGDDSDSKVAKRRATKTKVDKRKEDEEADKDDEQVASPKKTKKLKRVDPKVDDSDEETNVNPPKGRILDLNEIRSELKGINKVKVPNSAESASEKDAASSDESTSTSDVKYSNPSTEEAEPDSKEKIAEKASTSSDDIYEFKEPEPFEFETRKIADDKSKKRLVPRVFDDTEKSPKKKVAKSPIKAETKDAVVDADKRRFKRSPVKKLEEPDVKESPSKVAEKVIINKIVDDPFDKLVESPSFIHVGKPVVATITEKSVDAKKIVKTLDEPLPLFHDLPEYPDVKLDILDEPSNEPFFSNKQQLFTDSNFAKDVISSEMVFAKTDEMKKDSDDEDHIRASIQRAIAQTSLTDDDSSDCTLNQPLMEFVKKSESKASFSEETPTEKEVPKLEKEAVPEKESAIVLSKQLTTVFQGSDSNLLDQIYTPPTVAAKGEPFKEINVKTCSKIVDSILQKFNLIKSKTDSPEAADESEMKLEPAEAPEVADYKAELDFKPKLESPFAESSIVDKKRTPKKIMSKEFIESDTDSDSEERLIIHSDEDSQTNTFEDKSTLEDETKPTISTEPTKQSKEDEDKDKDKRNFRIEDIKKSPMHTKEEVFEQEVAKEEEPDSHIHSLLCQETIPGSPAPSVTENKPKAKPIPEMPFASAPSSSNRNLLNNDLKPIKIERNPSPVIMHPVEIKRGDNLETSTVLDNTPPTTPESTISNLSPRGDNGGLSPNAGDNDSCKSTENEVEYSSQRRTSASKIAPYSEEDTLMNGELSTSNKKGKDDVPSPCKKRRRSCKGTDEPPLVKRGRKPINRSRHNSDSDDTSEHSMQGTTSVIPSSTVDTRFSRSPRPSKYNFYVEFDPSLDSGQRIAVLQQKLQDLRKTYADVKAELAAIERRRKKIRRREKEGKRKKKGGE